MIKAGQQAVGIRRQIQANHVCLLVCNVVKEARILMGKAVVILLPYVGSQNEVQGCNRSDATDSWLQTFSHFACCAAMESTMRMNAS